MHIIKAIRNKVPAVKKANNNIRSSATPILLSLFSAGLAGCSTNNTVAPTTVSGTAIKGLLKNAEAFIDTDGDGSWTSGADSAKVRTAADGSFSIETDLVGDIIVQTDESTIDASSGAVLAGVTLSAVAGSSVVSVATTITNELMDSAVANSTTLSQADAEAQVKAILGLDASVPVSSYNPYAAANAGSAAALQFEKSAQQVMTVINTLAEAEAATTIGTSVSKSAAIGNAVAAFVDVIEAQVATAGTNPVADIDFTATSIIDDVVAAAVVNDSTSAFADTTFAASLTAIKTAINTVNTAIDAVTSLDASSKQTFAVAQAALVDMTQAVSANNDAGKATIDSTTDVSKLVVVSGTTAGIVTEDDAKSSDAETGNLVLSGTASVTDPDTTDATTYTFSTTTTFIASDSAASTAIGSLTITADGVWTYTVDDSHADIQALGVKDALVEVFQIQTIATDATDPDSLVTSNSVTKYIQVKINGSNDAPTLSEALADATTAEDAAFSVSLAKTLVTDTDTKDIHKVTATLENGEKLPEWLTLTSHDSGDNIATLAGTPKNGDVGAINITLTYSDGTATVSDTLTLTITNTNDAPTVATVIEDQTIAEDAALSFTVPSGTFTDVDKGDTSTLSATLEGGAKLPDWLTFTAATGILSGTPSNAEVGSINVTVTSTDGSAATVSDTFKLTTTNTNDAPTVATAQSAQKTSKDQDFSYAVPTITFADIDVGDALTYSATLADGGLLPAWLTFNAATATFSGTPADSDIAVLSITVTASDGTATASNNLALTVTDNTVPTVAAAQADQTATEDSAFTYTVPTGTFADVEDATLTISADGLPDGLTFTDGVISGTPTNAAVGDNTVSIIATDSGGASVTDQITISVANVNDAPTLVTDLVDQSIVSGRESTYTPTAGSFSDIDAADTLAYAANVGGADLPSWLQIDSATGAFTANPTSSDAGTIAVTIIATESASAGLTATDTFNIAVTANSAPAISSLANQTATEDTAVGFSLADSDFTDADGDSMTVTVSGNPSWLDYDAGTKTFSGTPTTESHAGTRTITVTATDASSAAGTATFNLVTTAVNDAPSMAASSAVTVTENSFLAAALTATDEESDAITYSVTGGADSALFGINSAGDGLVFTTAGSARTDMNLLLDSAGAQGGLMVDNLTTSVSGTSTTLQMDLWVIPKVVDIEALIGLQFTPTTSGTAADFDFYFTNSNLPKNQQKEYGELVFDGDGNPQYDIVKGTGGEDSGTAIWKADNSNYTNSMEAINIGILKISNYDASNTYSIDTLLMGGGDAGSATYANYTLNNLSISPLIDLPDFGDNGSAAGSDVYSVEVTATDATGNTSVQALTITLGDTAANANSSTATATWTGTDAADTYTIDSLTATADGGNGDGDVAKISIENHTTWDTTGGTTELAASLVDMEIIDIGNLVMSNDAAATTIADFSTSMTINSASAATMVAGSDSTVSIMGTSNDIVTLSGTAWVKGASSSPSSGDYASQTVDAWTDSTSTLYIDQDINIVTPDIS